MAEKQFLTKKGYDERVARLEELKVVRRKEVAQKLKEAREQGDLSENAEYDAAKDEQRDIETEIARMLSLSYGVWAVHQPYNDSRRGYFYDALNELIKSGRITRNDMVAYLSGSFGEGGGTSFLEINNVGKVLDAGSNYQLPTFKE